VELVTSPGWILISGYLLRVFFVFASMLSLSLVSEKIKIPFFLL